MTPSNKIDPSSSVFPETLGKAKSNKRLQGRKILLVGAGQIDIGEEEVPIGNGRAAAVLCAREGASVVCLDINKTAADETVKQIREEGGEAFSYVFDVRDADGIVEAVNDAKRILGGRIDGLVLGVGLSSGLPWLKITPESWDDEFAVNLRSHMLFSQCALIAMDEGSSIVMLSSTAGQSAASGYPAYETSKAAQMALGRAIAKMGEPRGTRANVIAPGYVDTPRGRLASRRSGGRAYSVPFGRQGTGWELAYLVLFLLSHESSYISGATINMDAGAIGGIVGRVRKVDGSIEKL